MVGVWQIPALGCGLRTTVSSFSGSMWSYLVRSGFVCLFCLYSIWVVSQLWVSWWRAEFALHVVWCNLLPAMHTQNFSFHLKLEVRDSWKQNVGPAIASFRFCRKHPVSVMHALVLVLVSHSFCLPMALSIASVVIIDPCGFTALLSLKIHTVHDALLVPPSEHESLGELNQVMFVY